MRIKTLLVLCTLVTSIKSYTQINFVSEFKAIPAVQQTSKAAFAGCKTIFFNSYYSYNNYGKVRQDYGSKLMNYSEPYKKIEEDKAHTVNAVAPEVANDFSDLNSPEVQAKIAGMSQEEKLKYALEIQKRMQANQGVQKINSTYQTSSPVVTAQLKVNDVYLKFLAKVDGIKMQHAELNYNKSCEGICGSEVNNGDACAKKMASCESKAAHEYIASEEKNYASYVSQIKTEYDKFKVDMITALSNYEAVAKNVSEKDKSASHIAILGYMAKINEDFGKIEKEGAEVIITAKNNAYTSKEY